MSDLERLTATAEKDQGAEPLYRLLLALRAVALSGRQPREIVLSLDTSAAIEKTLGGRLALPTGAPANTIFGVPARPGLVPDGGDMAIYCSSP